ncbi:hypothetical protein ACIQNU_18970 [Streptomyces sp. NPDC091292]
MRRTLALVVTLIATLAGAVPLLLAPPAAAATPTAVFVPCVG